MSCPHCRKSLIFNEVCTQLNLTDKPAVILQSCPYCECVLNPPITLGSPEFNEGKSNTDNIEVFRKLYD